MVIEHHNNPTKRISAQRYMQLSESVAKQNYETAEMQLKQAYKNQTAIAPQSDYSQVLVSLFAEEIFKKEVQSIID